MTGGCVARAGGDDKDFDRAENAGGEDDETAKAGSGVWDRVRPLQKRLYNLRRKSATPRWRIVFRKRSPTADLSEKRAAGQNGVRGLHRLAPSDDLIR